MAGEGVVHSPRSAMTNFRVSMPRTDTGSVALLSAGGEQGGLASVIREYR
jgi:hypothetical protein